MISQKCKHATGEERRLVAHSFNSIVSILQQYQDLRLQLGFAKLLNLLKITLILTQDLGY